MHTKNDSYTSVVIFFPKSENTSAFFEKIQMYRKIHIMHFIHFVNTSNKKDDKQYIICKFLNNEMNSFFNYFDNLHNISHKILKNIETITYYKCNVTFGQKIVKNKFKFIDKTYSKLGNQLVFMSSYNEFFHKMIVKKIFTICKENFIEKNYSMQSYLINDYITNENNIISQNENENELSTILLQDLNVDNSSSIVNNVTSNITNDDISTISYQDLYEKDNTNHDDIDFMDETINTENKIDKLYDNIYNIKSELFSTFCDNLSNLIALQVKIEINKEKNKLNLNNIPDNIKQYIDKQIAEGIQKHLSSLDV